MIRAVFWAIALAGAAAPYQCKSNDPERARDETPGEALWINCGRLADSGDEQGARTTLDTLIERYPSSRFAARASEEKSAAHPCASVTAATSAAAARASASTRTKP